MTIAPERPVLSDDELITISRRVFTEQDGTPEDAELVITPEILEKLENTTITSPLRPKYSPEQEADLSAAHDYAHEVPLDLRGKELAFHVAEIVRRFPHAHDQGIVCDASRACMVGWTGFLAAAPQLLPVIEAVPTSGVGSKPKMERLLTAAGLEKGMAFPDQDGMRALIPDFDSNEYDATECLFAAELLGIPDEADKLYRYVYNETNRKTALHNFEVLTGLKEGDMERIGGCPCSDCR